MKKLLKNLVLAIVPAMVLACSVHADENDLFNELAATDTLAISDADINVQEFDLDDLDVDQLADAAGQDEDQALEACFRRIGYHGYSRYYYPRYSHVHCYRTYTYYRPLYHHHTYYTTYYTPVYHSYWGCY
ncbi:hypothetical protein [Roseimaritima sediminicola]|uniref:hypothetical protein n=1 Tax=Roseimaritima sediminicola TaxID=2662066 RepID=UPI001298473E|nr:hypothetical protein [Roseimaritima sediminicola]